MAVCPKKAPTLPGSQWPNRPRATNCYGKREGNGHGELKLLLLLLLLLHDKKVHTLAPESETEIPAVRRYLGFFLWLRCASQLFLISRFSRLLGARSLVHYHYYCYYLRPGVFLFRLYNNIQFLLPTFGSISIFEICFDLLLLLFLPERKHPHSPIKCSVCSIFVFHANDISSGTQRLCW